MARAQTEHTLRTIWGMAKSPPLSMNDEELHLFVAARTGKESLRELDQQEIRHIVAALAQMKESTSGKRYHNYSKRGNKSTQHQRQKIYRLAQELGWDSPKRINGFTRRMFGVSCIEWLDYEQCCQMIEGLKAIVKREQNQQAKGGQGYGKNNL